MLGNFRRPIYAAITEALRERSGDAKLGLSVAQRIEIDRFIDKTFPEIPRQ